MTETKTKAKFTDPITGETSEFEICAVATPGRINEIGKYGIDVETHIQAAIEKEVKYTQQSKYYDSIKDYAEQNNFMRLRIDDPYNLPSDVLNPVMDIISKSKRPQIILSASTATMLEEPVFSRLPNTHHNRNGVPTDAISPLMSVEMSIGEDKKIVEASVNPYLPWNNHTCLVFDTDNPKNCKLVEFNFEM